jgi:threonine synthase
MIEPFVKTEKISAISFLECPECQKHFLPERINTYCDCNNPLIAHYILSEIGKNDIDLNERSMWRYARLLPVFERQNIISLGEGWTPLMPLKNIAESFDMRFLYVKDESQNPTCSFKARGMSAAISKAKELGIENGIVPTAGNAGGAMAAYCARAGMKATVVMPSHTPKAFKTECDYFGASLILVDGLISDCAKKVAELNQDKSYFDFSTMKEPYRLEGKKTMGYEVAEQLNWNLPDVILYPTGGGTGMIGMWKAFKEMMAMGWITSGMPRFVAVQTENCKPVVETFLLGKSISNAKPTLANGLAVPFPFAHRLIQQVLHDSSGSVIAVSEKKIMDGVKQMASREGMLIAPEGGALLAALDKLLLQRKIQRDEKVLLLNTGSGYKYMEAF